MSIMRHRLALTGLVALAAVAGPGCATFHFRGSAPKAAHTYRDKAHNAYENAMAAVRDRDWRIALTRLRHVKDHFPYSQYAALAEVGIADCLFGQDKYLEAADAYARFARLRPGNPQAGYAAYRTGVSYMRQAPSNFFLFPPAYEKDLTDVKKAIAAVQGFLSGYPKSKYRTKAEKLLKKARDRLIDHEMYVAHFYERHHKWRGMAWRLQGVLETYPGQGYDARARVGLADAYLHYSKPRIAAARRLLGQVLHGHPSASVKARAEALEKSLPPASAEKAAPVKAAASAAPAKAAPAKAATPGTGAAPATATAAAGSGAGGS